MAQQDQNSTTSTQFGQNADSWSDRLQEEKRGAAAAYREVRDDISGKAGELASDAKQAAMDKIEDVQHGVGASLKAFGGAIRAAGDHLADGRQTGASRIMMEAAGGLERLSDSLENRPFGEVIDELRTFGRNNGVALFAGALLAGLALGRVVRTAGSAAATSNGSMAGDTSSTGGSYQPSGESSYSGASSYEASEGDAAGADRFGEFETARGEGAL